MCPLFQYRSSIEINFDEQLPQGVVIIYNKSGVMIRQILGRTWDGKDMHGNEIPGGIYYINVSVDGKSVVVPIIKLK